MAKTADPCSPVDRVGLSGTNPFLHYSRPEDVFRDVFDVSDRFNSKEYDETSETGPRQRNAGQFTTVLKRTETVPRPINGTWKWDKNFGLLFVPLNKEYADARNETRKLAHDEEAVLKIAGKVTYKPHRTSNDKVLEGYAKLLNVKEEKSEIVVEESRQVQLRDIKRGAVHLNKFSLHNKIPEQFLRYYDEYHCAKGVQSFMKYRVYDEFLTSLIHYFYFYLLGLTQKYFRLTLKKGRLFRLPGQLEIPLLKERIRARRIFRYEIQNARLELAKKYVAMLQRVLGINQPSPGSFKYRPHPVVPERFFFESLLNVSCLAVCVAFLQRSNRLIRAEFGRLFRREAFNPNSLERTIDTTEYETYADRALRVFAHSRKSIMDRRLMDKSTPRMSPKTRRLRLSDALVKPEKIDWKNRVKSYPKVWQLKPKKPFYVNKPSIPEKTDYANHKHRLSVEMRKNSPIVNLLFGRENQELRDALLHTVPEISKSSLLAKLRKPRHHVARVHYRWLTPFHLTLGIIGKRLRQFDYWTLLPVMANEKNLTLPGLTREARYRAFKTMLLVFPQRPNAKKSTAKRHDSLRNKTKTADVDKTQKL